MHIKKRTAQYNHGSVFSSAMLPWWWWLFIIILGCDDSMSLQLQENPIATDRSLSSDFHIAFLWITSLLFGRCAQLVIRYRT